MARFDLSTLPKRTGSISKFERKLVDYLRSKELDIETQIALGPWRFDARIRGTNIFIEADGEYWHKMRPDSDARKDAWCQEQGYTLFRIAYKQFTQNPWKAIEPLLRHYLTMIYNGEAGRPGECYQ